MSLADAFAPAEAAHRTRVISATWGHLAPTPRKVYAGHIIFTEGEYGHLIIIRSDFPELENSPWQFEDFHDWLGKQSTEPGTIYRFDGTYTRFKSGGYRLSGATCVISAPVTP